MAHETHRGFAEVEGGRLYYEVAGDGDPVALIHGFGLDARMWDAQAEALADRYRVIRYDARGFGRSSVPAAEPFSHAGDLRALLRRLDVAPAHVVGLSMGGRIALNLALLDPAAVRSLTLVDAALDGFDWSAAWSASFDAMEECADATGSNARNGCGWSTNSSHRHANGRSAPWRSREWSAIGRAGSCTTRRR